MRPADPGTIAQDAERTTPMAQREEMGVEILTPQGWYRGYVTLPAGGRLIDYLNTKPLMIALTHAVEPSGARRAFLAVNTEQILAIRPQPEPEE
jgi:hypothetical protein